MDLQGTKLDDTHMGKLDSIVFLESIQNYTQVEAFISRMSRCYYCDAAEAQTFERLYSAQKLVWNM